MGTLGSSLARLPVRFRPPHPCIVLLVLVILLALPAAAMEEVYQVEGDAADPVPVYQQTAAELLADAGIMPLNLTSQESAWLNNIQQRLIYGNTSAAQWLANIYNSLGSKTSISGTIFNMVDDMSDDTASMLKALTGTGYVGGVGMGEGVFGHLRNMTANYLSPISSNMSATYSQVKAIADKLAAGVSSYPDFALKSGWAYLDADGVVKVAPYDLEFTYFLDVAFLGLAGRMQSYLQRLINRPGLLSDGSITGSYGYAWNLADLTADGFVGLAKRLSGDDRTTTFSFLQEDIQSVQQITADNLLDALGIMGTQLQQPLQRLAYVFANPQDLEIRQDVSDNVDSAQDNFFKPDGAGAVSPGNIQDAAGISGGAAGALQSPGSVGDVTGQINNPDNFSFFSSVTLGNLDTVPVPASDDDDGFIDFYDPDNAALWEALGK